MKKGNLIALAVIVIGAVLFFVFKNQDRSITLDVKADFFQVKDTQEVTKIFVVDLDGNSVTLDRKGFYWTVNGKYRADRVSLNNLFEPLVKMRIKAPVSDNDKNDLVKELTVRSKKVEIYRNGQKTRTLFIGNATADGLSTYIYSDDEGLDRPYIVHIPGWNGNLGPRFFFKELAWRSKKVFHHNPSQIEFLEVDYKLEPQASFRLENLGSGKVAAKGLYDVQDSIKDLKVSKVSKVFVNSNQLFYEDFILASAKGKIDTITNVLPLHATVTIKLKNKEPKVLLLKVQPSQDQKQLDAGRLSIDRFYAYYQGDNPPQIGLLQQQMAAKLLQNFDRFENSK
jgi:hypothetical protein